MNFNLRQRVGELKEEEETERDIGKRQGYEDILREDWFPWVGSTERLIALLGGKKKNYKEKIEETDIEKRRERYKGRIEAMEEYQEHLRDELERCRGRI